MMGRVPAARRDPRHRLRTRPTGPARSPRPRAPGSSTTPTCSPRYGCFRGKGEALWKASTRRAATSIVWADTDVRNWHPRMVYGTLGPLLDRAAPAVRQGLLPAPDRRGRRAQGGRRRAGHRARRAAADQPVLSRSCRASSSRSPGEYAGRRALLEAIPFFTGYAVEIGHLIDAAERLGLEGLGQVDLERRVHRNQELEGLSRMSFVILQAVMKRLEERRKARLFAELGSTMKLPRSGPRPAVARGHRAGRPGAAADDAGSPSTSSAAGRPSAAAGPTRAGPAVSGRRHGPHRARLVQGLADLGRGGTRPGRRLARARPDDELLLVPARRRRRRDARGRRGGRRLGVERTAPTVDPLGRPIDARWLRSTTASRAVVELADGVRAVAAGAPTSATRWRPPRVGTGDLIRAALDAGPRQIVARASAAAPRPTAAPGSLRRARSAAVEPRRRSTSAGLDAAARPTLELLRRLRRDQPAARADRRGRDLWARRRAPSPADVIALDAQLARFADAARGARPAVTSATRPGAGAAGGVGFALLCRSGPLPRRCRSSPGVDLVMEATELRRRLAGADLVITGEGRIDAQTAFGKTALGVARRAQAAGVPLHRGRRRRRAGGHRGPRAARRRRRPGHRAARSPVAEAMAAGAAPLERCGERLGRAATSAGGMSRRAPRPRSEPDAERPAAPRKRKFSDPGRDLGQAPRALPARARRVRPRRAGRALRPADLAAPPRPDQRADPDDPDPEQRRHERRGGLRGAPRGAIPAAARSRPTTRAPAGAATGLPDGRAAGLGGGRGRATPRAGRHDPAGRPRQPEGAPDPGRPCA